MAATIIRRLAEADWHQLREVRLAALLDSPAAFGGSIDAERALEATAWQRRLRTATWVLAEVGTEVAGIAAVEPSDADRGGDAWIWSWWVDPAHRGAGVGTQLLDALDDTCRAHGWTRQSLGVFAENTAAIRAFERLGFVVDGPERPSRTMPGRRYVLMRRARPS